MRVPGFFSANCIPICRYRRIRRSTNTAVIARACLDICPTRAIVAPYQVDARRCISYLTIELKGAIPEALRPLIGNRIYGCDDCQQVCPWNRFSQPTAEPDFAPRHGLDSATLLALFGWSEDTFLSRTEGSAIRRIGYPRWQRNIAVALGNAPMTRPSSTALRRHAEHPDPMVREHVEWALERQHALIRPCAGRRARSAQCVRRIGSASSAAPMRPSRSRT